MKLKSWISMSVAAGMTAVGIAGLHFKKAPTVGESVSMREAARLVGGATDGYFRNPMAGCGAYSKLGTGGTQLRCAFSNSITSTNRLLGVWGTPGLGGTCTQCGVTCGSTQTIGQPKEG